MCASYTSRTVGNSFISNGPKESKSPNSSLFVIEELLDARHRLVLGVEGAQRAGAGQGIAGEEAFVEHLATAEGAAGDVPGQTEELDALAGGGGVGGQVLLDLRSQRAAEVRLARSDHEAAGSEELQDLHHSGIGGHEEGAGALRRQPGRTTDGPP